MIAKQEYTEYLWSTPFNDTYTNMADHSLNLSHDVSSDFLQLERFNPARTDPRLLSRLQATDRLDEVPVP